MKSPVRHNIRVSFVNDEKVVSINDLHKMGVTEDI